mgnify:CR=1 FL=1
MMEIVFQFLSGFQERLPEGKVLGREELFQFLSGFQIRGNWWFTRSGEDTFNSFPDSRENPVDSG